MITETLNTDNLYLINQRKSNIFLSLRNVKEKNIQKFQFDNNSLIILFLKYSLEYL